jgi:hypothetical protein
MVDVPPVIAPLVVSSLSSQIAIPSVLPPVGAVILNVPPVTSMAPPAARIC